MKYFDAHTHLNFVAYDADRVEVTKRALAAGVGMNVVGTQFDTSQSAVALAEQYDDVYATIGLHPVHTAKSYHDEKELGEGGKAFTSRGEIFDAARRSRIFWVQVSEDAAGQHAVSPHAVKQAGGPSLAGKRAGQPGNEKHDS